MRSILGVARNELLLADDAVLDAAEGVEDFLHMVFGSQTVRGGLVFESEIGLMESLVGDAGVAKDFVDAFHDFTFGV